MPEPQYDKIAFNAATHPIHMAVFFAGLVVSLLLSSGLVFLLAFLTYAALTGLEVKKQIDKVTNSKEAKWRKLAGEMPYDLREKATKIINTALSVEDTTKTLDSLDITVDVDEIVNNVLQMAKRGTQLDTYLNSTDIRLLNYQLEDAKNTQVRNALTEQIEVYKDLQMRRNRIGEQIEELDAQLGAVRARMLQAQVSSQATVSVRSDIQSLSHMARSVAESYSQIESINADTQSVEDVINAQIQARG